MKRERLSLAAIGSAIYRRPPFGTDDGRFDLEDGPFCRHGEAVGSLCCECGDGKTFAFCRHINGINDVEECPVGTDPLVDLDVERGRRMLADLWRFFPDEMDLLAAAL